MNGLVYTINKLGEALAQMEETNGELRAELEVLREQLAAAEKPTPRARPSRAKRSAAK